MRLRELRKLVEQILAGGGGSGSLVLHETDLPDQSITLVDVDTPQLLADLWRVSGPGLVTLLFWGEVKPLSNVDSVSFQLWGDLDSGGSQVGYIGPYIRQYMDASEVLPGGWIRISGQVPEFVMMPTNFRDYELRVSGFQYHDDDPTDTSLAISGDIQIRNFHIAAVRLG